MSSCQYESFANFVLSSAIHSSNPNPSTRTCQQPCRGISHLLIVVETTAGRTNLDPDRAGKIGRMRESRRQALTEAQLIKTGSATSGQASLYTAIHVYDHVSVARHRRRRSPGHRVVASSRRWSIDRASGLPQTHTHRHAPLALRFLLGKRSWRSLIAALHECAK